MNARDEDFRGGEPTEPELSLERELRQLQPWRPSLNLRQRIAAEAARSGPEGNDSGAELSVRRFPVLPRAHALAAVAASVLLVGIVLAPLWTPRDESEALAAGETAGEEAAGASLAAAPAGWVLWDRVPDPAEPPAWEREQVLPGSESLRMLEPEGGPAMWRVRYRVLNRKAWKDQETGVLREHFTPEERVLFVPVRHH